MTGTGPNRGVDVWLWSSKVNESNCSGVRDRGRARARVVTKFLATFPLDSELAIS